ncbi:hypothetical protein TTHERM_00077590 (macronuclear) [Tetrahymena thermophila SB210]|uniref:Centrosomal protein of 19 kDa n=1 Tax=Tetrahymena thermophila (strain SB210) TaxID=312017 RepID=Q23G05_TETTS|nr:hypothetical protein TTHERM_00077590 [Tetrahymena thermophila SB210]EAR95455.1 hypothetical protein TTHERM_00077590 [Tetrahymena thermophila SB210]|eukprot:XP_001015700.1 hypothetical protein TTHERM_00077590 [Tetrahymena thermophila SB210]
MQTGLPTKLVPLKWVVKYNPAQIGLVYKLNEKDKKKRLYIIDLNDLVMNPDCEKVAKRLFLEHPLYLNKNVVSIQQVALLVHRIQQQLNLGDDHYEGYESNQKYDHQDQNKQNYNENDFQNEYAGYEEISEDNEYP